MSNKGAGKNGPHRFRDAEYSRQTGISAIKKTAAEVFLGVFAPMYSIPLKWLGIWLRRPLPYISYYRLWAKCTKLTKARLIVTNQVSNTPQKRPK